MKILLLAEDKSANTISWVKAFQRAGCDVKIVSARAKKDYGNVIALGMNHLPPRLKFLLGSKRIKEIVKTEKPDILIAYRVTSYGYLAASFGFHPLVLAAQNEQIIRLPFLAFPFKPFIKKCVHYAVKSADLIHAWGDNIKDGLLRFGAPQERILVMHRGINLDIFKPLSTKEFSTAKSPVLISTRSLYTDYRIDLLIKAFALYLKKRPDAVLKIVGDGPERKPLQSLCRKLGIAEKVVFYKHLDAEITSDLLRSADIYISLIRTEGVSSSLIEACACGVFPIVADIKASREVVEDHKNGLLLSTDNPKEISDAIHLAYGNLELRKSAYIYNQELVKEKFDSKKNCENFVKHYEKLLISKVQKF